MVPVVVGVISPSTARRNDAEYTASTRAWGGEGGGNQKKGRGISYLCDNS